MRDFFLSIAAAAAVQFHAGSAPPPPDASATTLQMQDLELVRSQYLPKEKAYGATARRRAIQRLDRLEARAGALDQADMLVGLALLGGLADNGHSGIRFHAPGALPKARLPLRLLWLPGGLIVARATGPASDLAGARVERVEGLDPDQLYAKTQGLKGGKKIDRQKYLPEFYESYGVLKALGLAREASRLTMTFILPSGRRETRSIAMVAQDAPPSDDDFSYLWSPDPRVTKGWRSALTPRDLPLYLQDADRPFRLVPLPKIGAAYLQFRSNESEQGWEIPDFLAEVRNFLASKQPENLIVDLRFDIGGNLTTTLSFMRALPQMVEGRTILLVGPYTFSAGIISAAAVKQSGGARVTIIGDDVGDRRQFWSEGGIVDLPHSHFRMRYTDGQFDLDRGCAGKPGCMDGLVNVNGVSLKPDIFAPLTLEAYLGKHDPAFAAAERLLAAQVRH